MGESPADVAVLGYSKCNCLHNTIQIQYKYKYKYKYNEIWMIFWDKIKDFTKSPTFWTCLIYFTKKVLSFKLGLTFSWAASLSIKEGDWQDMWDLLVYKNHLQIWIQNTNTSKNQSQDGRRDAKKSTLCVVPTTTIQF